MVPDVTEELGSEVHVIFTIDAPPVSTEDTRAVIEGDGEDVLAPLAAAEGRSVFTARVDAHTTATPGKPMRLTMDPQSFHFFDPETGRTIPRSREVVATA